MSHLGALELRKDLRGKDGHHVDELVRLGDTTSGRGRANL